MTRRCHAHPRAAWPRRGTTGRKLIALAALAAATLLAVTSSVPASARAITPAGGPAASARPAVAAAMARRPAATTTGTLRGWGRNEAGELGDGSTARRTTPVTVRLPSGTRVRSVRSECSHTLALTASGAVLAWGTNQQGELGDGTATDRHRPVRVKLPGGTRVSAVRAGCQFSLALTTTGRVLAWGDGDFLGAGNGLGSEVPVPVMLPAATRITAIATGGVFSLALTSTGRVLAWGDNSSGQLGDGTTSSRLAPVAVRLPAGVRVRSLAAGEDHSLALTRSSQVLAWGLNSTGQLGDGTVKDRHKPERIRVRLPGPPAGKITALIAGCAHSMALTSHRLALAWGDNRFGELGIGTRTTSRRRPARVHLPAGTTVTALSANCESSMALTSSGRVLTWGSNQFGQLGTGRVSAGSPVPVRVHLPRGLRAVAIGSGPEALQGFAVVRRSGR